MPEPKQLIEFPSNQEFFANSPLYATFPVPEKPRLYTLLFTSSAIDLFCTACNDSSVFRPLDNRPPYTTARGPVITRSADDWGVNPSTLNLIISKEFHCSRVDSHKISFFVQVTGGFVSKVGQSVSLADLAEQNIRGFKKVLGDSYREFSTSIGLASHGVGVGVFVYLRRIIEQLVVKPAHEKAKLVDGWDESAYQRSRFGEKIDLLRHLLPDFLVDNKPLYSVLSKGIHELSEEECKKYFPTVQACIELVLTELESKRREKEKRGEVSAKLAQVAGGI